MHPWPQTVLFLFPGEVWPKHCYLLMCRSFSLARRKRSTHPKKISTAFYEDLHTHTYLTSWWSQTQILPAWAHPAAWRSLRQPREQTCAPEPPPSACFCCQSLSGSPAAEGEVGEGGEEKWVGNLADHTKVVLAAKAWQAPEFLPLVLLGIAVLHYKTKLCYGAASRNQEAKRFLVNL